MISLAFPALLAAVKVVPTKNVLKAVVWLVAVFIFFTASPASSDPGNVLRIFHYSSDVLDEYENQKNITIAAAANIILLRSLNIPTTYHLEPKKRIIARMKQGEPLCMPERIKTPERQKNFLFSDPVYLYPALRLYQLKRSRPIPQDLLNAQGEIVSLAEVFHYLRDRTLFIGEGKSYGEALDRAVKEIKGENLFIRKGSYGQYAAKRHMFLNNRVDFVLEYPAEIFQDYPVAPNDIRSYPLAESPKYLLGHYMCTKSAQSEAIVQRINAALKRLYVQGEIMQAQLYFYLPSEKPIIKSYMQEAFFNMPSELAIR